jgi:hypothetical protein
MSQWNRRGVAIVEFSFATLLLVPLLVGMTGIGLNLVAHLQTVQLARDSGYMYARQVDFTQTANQTVLLGLGAELGLSTNTATSQSVLILSQVTYVDSAMCKSDNKWNNTTNAPNGCTNYLKWVFAQRISIGNPSVHSSNFGAPVTTGANPVSLDSEGNVALDTQVTNAGDVAVSSTVGGVQVFAGISPYQSLAGNVSGLPSGQVVYVAEAAGKGFNMPPFAVNPVMYSYNLF